MGQRFFGMLPRRQFYHRRRNHGCSGCSCTHNIQPEGAGNVFCTPNILEQNTLFIIHKHIKSSMTKSFHNTRVNIAVNVVGKHVKSIRNRFDHSFVLPLECWNPFTRAPLAASDLGLCTLHPQCSRRSYAREFYARVSPWPD